MKNGRFTRRLGYAWAGIREAWRREQSFRTQLWFAAAAPIYLAILQPALIWWALVAVMVALVLAAELFNTALEQLVDHLHPEIHPAMKVAKDCAAGAVLLLSMASVLVALLALLSVLVD